MIPNQWYAVLSSKDVPRGQITGACRFGENLVAADLPIIQYRKMREELKKDSTQ